MSYSIAGKTAIVTGAANGVGLAIARHFVNQGACVMFADMDETKLATEVDAVKTEDRRARYFAGDLRQRLTLANLLSATIDAFDRVDILVNASRQVLRSDPLNPDEDAFEALIEQNLTTSLRLTQVVAKRLIKQAEDEGSKDGNIGSIVNITSIAATRAHPQLLAYSISAAALDQMTRSMAVALAANRIRVNAVAFGSVMSASLRFALKEHPDLRGIVSDATPLGRIGEANEVAEAVQYLASESSSFVTGQILTVDGGRTLIDPVVTAAH
ncbi:MAG: SDR family oxidoreductase [Alphaproteobacteria bacterium]|nr:SDR family oxidoreductase [Alphaproteobacteria bacterium]